MPGSHRCKYSLCFYSEHFSLGTKTSNQEELSGIRSRYVRLYPLSSYPETFQMATAW